MTVAPVEHDDAVAEYDLLSNSEENSDSVFTIKSKCEMFRAEMVKAWAKKAQEKMR